MLPDDYKPPQDHVASLHSYAFSDRLTQYSCSTCGTLALQKFYKTNKDCLPKWTICTGTLEFADGIFDPAANEFIGDTIDGGFSDFLPSVHGKQINRWTRGPGDGEQLPLYWQLSSRPKPDPKPSDRLHVHCKCSGVSFYIARPSARTSLEKPLLPSDRFSSEAEANKHLDTSAWWLRESGSKYLARACSCDSCRLATGQEWVVWSFVPMIEMSLDKEGNQPFTLDTGTLKHYRSSDVATRHFCGECGATVFWEGDERPHILDVAVGLLDAPEGARAESWLWWETDFVSFREDGMPRAKALTEALESGLAAYGEHQRNRSESLLTLENLQVNDEKLDSSSK
ncbi:hypothetical protein LTR15_011720 [Elasticomyces elasticus]|nr:hypothetical protein LTR15_011720 [Elasticomyces elasticus]